MDFVRIGLLLIVFGLTVVLYKVTKYTLGYICFQCGDKAVIGKAIRFVDKDGDVHFVCSGCCRAKAQKKGYKEIGV